MIEAVAPCNSGTVLLLRGSLCVVIFEIAKLGVHLWGYIVKGRSDALHDSWKCLFMLIVMPAIGVKQALETAVGGIRKSCERRVFAAADTENLQLTSYMNYFQTYLNLYSAILPFCHLGFS